MSSDLLKRAAAKLRAVVMELPDPWASQSWRVVASDTESLDAIAACRNSHADDPHGAHDCCWSSEPVGHERVAELIVLLHPPVALAVADWLGDTATDVEAAPVPDDECPCSWIDGYHKAADVARAILREEATS